MQEKLQRIIEGIRNHELYKEFDGNFPYSATLTRYPEKHLPIIVEQAELIIKNSSHFKIEMENYDTFIEKYIMDIRFFFTENSLSIENELLVGMGQLVIPSHALFHVAASREYPDRYKNQDLLSHPSAYDSFSIPFILRLSIENKIKEMIGYDYCDYKNGNKGIFPFSLIINFLISNNSLQSPCPFQQIKKIYTWACRFTHTAQKEYIWLKLKALQCLQPLFDYRLNKKYQISQGLHGKLNYLNSGVTLQDLMNDINENPKIKRRFKFYLSEDNFGNNFGSYDSEKREYV